MCTCIKYCKFTSISSDFQMPEKLNSVSADRQLEYA